MCSYKTLKKKYKTPQKPVESPRKIAQRKRKLDVQKSLQNTTILSENLDSDITTLETKSYIFFNLMKKPPLLITITPLGQKCICRAIENTEIYYILKSLN